MFTTLLIPHVPVIAAQMALATRDAVIVQDRGRVVAPISLRGMPAERAARLCPEARVVPRRPDWERAAWDRIVEEVWAFTPLIADLGIGRLMCSPDSMPMLRSVVERTQAQCGLAPTRTLSTLAALAASEGGIMTIDDAAEASAAFLDALPVEHLQMLEELGLTDEIVERLRLFGLPTVGRLRTLTRHHLQIQFGTVGLNIHALLHTLADASPLPLYQPAPSVTERECFSDATNEPQVLLSALERCAERAIAALGGRVTQCVEVSVLDRADRVQHTRSRILQQAVGVLRPLHAQINAMLQSITHPQRWVWGTQLRLSALRLPPAEQLPLFRPRTSVSDINTALSRRYPTAIKRITITDPNAYLPERYASVGSWLVARSS